MKMIQWVTVAKKEEIPEGQTRAFLVGDKNIAVSCVKGNYFAFIDVCSHMDFPLHDGQLDGTVIECAHHGATFDISTGAVLSMPAVTPIQTYKVKVEGEEVKIELEE